MRSASSFIALACAICATLAGAQEPKGSGTVVLRAARVIDGTGAAPIQNGVVVVTDDKIVAVGTPGRGHHSRRRENRSTSATRRCLPGFIDAHTHIIGRTLGDPAGDDAAGARLSTRSAPSSASPTPRRR